MEAWRKICGKTLAELKDLLSRGALSSVAVTGAYLESIAAQNPALNAYLEVYREEAIREAEASDARRRAGATLSPLDGIPIALKDNLLVQGRRCTCASRMLADFVAPYDATVAARLRGAGMPLLGRLNMDEFSMGGATQTGYFGPAYNPWDRGRTPGGSSGGSGAAVAAGMAPAALGSDTGGSVLQPAALCGVVGVRPAYGSVSRYGLVAFAGSLDQVGPLCKSVYDAALVMNAIGGHDPQDATSRRELEADFLGEIHNGPGGRPSAARPLEGVVLGLPRECWGPDAPQSLQRPREISPEVFRCLAQSLSRWQALGAEARPVSLPSWARGVEAYYAISSAQASSNLARLEGIRYGHQAAAGDWEALCRRSRAQGFGPEVKRRLLLGGYVLEGQGPVTYERAWALKEALGREAARAASACHGLLLPVTAEVAWPAGEKKEEAQAEYRKDRFGMLAALTGLPEISLPCGISPQGLPVGVGLLGAANSLPRLLAWAHAYERAYPLPGKRPYESRGKGGDGHGL